MLAHNPMLPFMFLSMFLGGLVLWIYCLIEVSRSTFKSETNKLMWVILLVMIPVVGCVLYLLIGREQRADDSNDLEL